MLTLRSSSVFTAHLFNSLVPVVGLARGFVVSDAFLESKCFWNSHYMISVGLIVRILLGLLAYEAAPRISESPASRTAMVEQR
jgi:hypothetical protein